jgi:catalase
MSGSASPETVMAQLVEAMRALAGSHPGFRPAHAKGIVCAGTFRDAPEARRVSRAPHLQGPAVPTVIRFSNASGNPDVHDGLANTRALSVKFQLPDGQNTTRSIERRFTRVKIFGRTWSACASQTSLPHLVRGLLSEGDERS